MRPFSLSRLYFGAALCGCLCAPSFARADAFSPIPAGNPIYRQLDVLVLIDDGKTPKAATNLTRYEAALQVARVAVVVTSKPDAMTRTGWKALRELTSALKVELRQLGVDVEDIQAACARQLDAPSKPLTSTGIPSRLPKPKTGSSVSSTPSLLGGSVSPATLGSTWNAAGSNLQLPLLNRAARVDAALLAMRRSASDPLAAGNGTLDRQNLSQFAGRDLSLSVGVNSWLNLSASSSQRQLGMGADVSPALSSQIFSGAREASSFGGGLEVSPVGGLKFGANVEQLSTNTGARATRGGVGIGLSAWQNRLKMSAYMGRLTPEDRAMMPATETDVKVALGFSQRLSLNLLYQGLFSSQTESSRVAGGLNFSF